MRQTLFVIVAVVSTWCSNRQLPTSSDKDKACSPIQYSISSCMPQASASTLEIMTWNIEHFPKDSSTVCMVSNIINALDVDIIAVQEIDSEEDFKKLINESEGWNGISFNVRGGIETGFLYKEAEIVSVSALKSIFPDNRSEFPREPVLIEVTHKNGLEVTLVNIHLKCCKDGEERRAKASLMLKQYIDDSLSTENVVVLGDFNDDILDNTPFENFILDSASYTFADREVALQGEGHWSYPSWPSHIDHILISNELADNLISTETVALDRCIQLYDAHVSDHRPLVVSLKKNESLDL